MIGSKPLQWNNLDSFTKVSLVLLGFTFLVHCVLSVFINQVFFPHKLGKMIDVATEGLINDGMQANLLLMVIILPLLILAGRQTCREFWLDRRSWQIAVVWLLGLTLLYQLCVIGVGRGEDLCFSTAWVGRGASESTGRLLAQLIGNALYEELLFRAFFLTQFYLHLRTRKLSIAASLTLAIIASQALFAIMHVPNRIYKGAYESLAVVAFDQIALFLFGVYYAIVMLAFRNLAVPIVLHTFWNAPPILLSSNAADWTDDASVNAFRLATLLVVFGSIVYAKARRTEPGRP
ncbi:CPBP family intramembrane glutamic endopeptidase [Planctomycetaceae bacterium SH139]